MKRVSHHRGFDIEVTVSETNGPRLHTKYTITPQTDEARSVYTAVVPKSGGETTRDIDKFQGADPMAEAADFTVADACGDIDATYAMAEARKGSS